MAELLKVDPLNLLTITPGSFIESGNNSVNTVLTMNSQHWQTTNDEQLKMTLKLIESVTSMSEKLIGLMEKK